MKSLQDIVKQIEDDKSIGIFSKSDKILGDKHSYEIPFKLKPSQQVLAALGGATDTKHPPMLTAKNNIKTTDNANVTVSSFAPESEKSDIIITGERINQLFHSGKIYVNTNIFPEGYYKKVLAKHLVGHKKLPVENNNMSWEHLAVGLCHAQEIDLLVSTYTSKHGRAHTTVLADGKIIDVNDPALLLLSSPRLDLSGNHDKELKNQDDKVKFITAMYRNLFNAAVTERRDYITMPAAGLGSHGGTPEMYFSTLMAVAKEYPQLNIIYNAGKHEKKFDKALEAAGKPENIARTSKNIIFVAADLLRQGKSCAIHNPSNSASLYGATDIGEHWQSDESHWIGKNPGRTLQAYIGTVSTAPLGSYGVNPGAFANIVEVNLNQAAIKIDIGKIDVIDHTVTSDDATSVSSKSTKSKSSKKPKTPRSPRISKKDKDMSPIIDAGISPRDSVITSGSQPSIPYQSPKDKPANPKVDTKTSQKPNDEIVPQPDTKTTDTTIPKVDAKTSQKPTDVIVPKLDTKKTDALTPKSDVTIPTQPPAKISPKSSADANGLFPPPKETPTTQSAHDKEVPVDAKSSFTDEQLEEIKITMDQLTREIQSYWPYPNKDVKQIKVDALGELITNSYVMDIPNAILAIKEKYPRVTEGRISTRTADLLDRLEANSMSLEY